MYNKYQIQESHPEWARNISRWQFLIDSYLGGADFRDGRYLLSYVMESQEEYEGRLDNTPLDNHVKAIAAIYNAFLFRQPPKRSFGTLTNDPSLLAFLEDCDLEGRTFNAMMRDVSTYSSVYGNVWLVIDKPETTAYTRAEELDQGVRPYLSIFTPENVIDWNYERAANGSYFLTYLKILESRSSKKMVYRIYTPEVIQVVSLDSSNETAKIESEVPNALGIVPAVCVYSQRSPVRGVGVSDVGDIADMQRAIYNELSEGEQLLRLTNHPSLVKTASTQAASGAGSIIQMPEDLQPELRPFLLQPSGASLSGLLDSMRHKIETIDRMAHMGGIRSIETRRLSGVGLATEFQLLNAKLAERAQNLELAEEQIWRIFSRWQGTVWDGQVDYPDSFNIQDKYNDMNMLKLAKDANPRSDIVHEEIERQMLRILVDDEERYQELADEIEIETVEGEVVAAEPEVEDMPDEEMESLSEGESCPIATQDVAVNLTNRQNAIDTANYGPLNPAQPNRVFWMALADKWSVTEEQAKGSRCGNCAAFNQTSQIESCIEQGLAAGGATGNEWDTVTAGDLGYCEAFDFKCASSRTCDAWVTGGPIVD
jgi:hypothetical protein